MIQSAIASPHKTIAIWQPYFLGGGAEAVALWALAALTKTYDVTVYTCTDLDLNKLDIMYGTALANTAINVKPLFPPRFAKTINQLIANSKPLRMAFMHLLIKRFKKDSTQYDLALSTFNATDLGRPGMQYIHWVNVIEGVGKQEPYWRAWSKKLSQFSIPALRENISLANSQYVADCIEQTYGLKSKVVYPPVVAHIENIPWEQKENAFICSGRIVKAKQIHQIIEILATIRDKGFDVTLEITGGGGDVYDQDYQTFIYRLIEKNQDWVHLHKNLPYQDYLKLLSKCRYGIHFKPEPFGISIAEMVKAGLIPFVRKRGGQVEIVGSHNEQLLFDKQPEAVRKIIDVLKDTAQQQSLIKALDQQKNLFSVNTFMRDITKAVSHYFEHNRL